MEKSAPINSLALFGAHLRKIRQEKNKTQAEVAETAGITTQMYYKYEAGKVEPRLFTLIALSKALGVGVDELCGSVASEIPAEKVLAGILLARVNDSSNIKLRRGALTIQLWNEDIAVLLSALREQLLGALEDEVKARVAGDYLGRVFEVDTREFNGFTSPWKIE